MQLREGIRKRRVTTAASPVRGMNGASEATPSSVNCPVCLEDFAPDGLDAFPCAHKTCKLCYLRCATCPLCRVDKQGVSDQERRDVRARMPRVIFRSVPHDRIPEFLAGGFLGESPFEGTSFSIRTSGMSAAMNAVIGDIVGEMINRRRRTGHAPTRGQLQQATAAAMFRSVSSSRRGDPPPGARRAGFEGPSSRFEVQDVLGRPIDLDNVPNTQGAEQSNSHSL